MPVENNNFDNIIFREDWTVTLGNVQARRHAIEACENSEEEKEEDFDINKADGYTKVL